MTLNGLAVDAGWLRAIDESNSDNDYYFECLSLLELFTRKSIPILLDQGGVIIAEYERVLKPGSMGRRFFSHRMSHGLFLFFDGNPTRNCLAALNADHFDPDDVAYIGVAQAGHGVYLTTEVKHLRDDRRKLVMKYCGVSIVDTFMVRDLC